MTGALAALALGLPAPVHAGALEAGAGRAQVAIPQTMLPYQRFGIVHDPLEARVLVLGNGAKRTALVVVDLTSIADEEVLRMQQIVAEQTGVAASDILICASHTFSAPHMSSPAHLPAEIAGKPAEEAKVGKYQAAYETALRQAAASAAHGLRAAAIGYGSGTSDINVNRNVLTPAGWWLGADRQGASDKTLGVVRIDGADHRPIAVLFNYAVQPSVLDHSFAAPDQMAISADLAGAASRYVEKAAGDPAVALFLVGAAGDQAPLETARRQQVAADGTVTIRDLGVDAYPLLTHQGETLGQDAWRVGQAIRPLLSAPRVAVVSGQVELTSQVHPQGPVSQLHAVHNYNYQITGKTRAPYVIQQVGDLAIVGVQVELSASTGAAIRARSPFAHTLVVTMVNGAAKYLPDADGYGKFTYEAMNSAYGPGSAEVMADAILARLRALHEQ